MEVRLRRPALATLPFPPRFAAEIGVFVIERIIGGPCSGEANGALRALQGYSVGRSGIRE
jgi:hypothetical protein